MIDIDENLIRTILPKRVQDSNKGTYGRVLNITGSKNYTGAGMLSAVSALKAGAGYSILCSDEETINLHKRNSFDLIYKSHGNFNIDIVKDITEKQNVSCVVYGCGIGLNKTTIEFTGELISYLKTANIPVVIDADGLNCLAQNPTELNNNFIITPHPKELSGLLQVDTDTIQHEREKFVQTAQKKYNCVVLLKGHNTLIADDKNVYRNTTGNSALSKAGTGDVLAGMAGGFLAQKISPVNAAILAAYIHGAAAEIYTEKFSEYSMLASDLFNYIPIALKKISD